MRKQIILSLIVLLALSLTAGLLIAAKKRAKGKADQTLRCPFSSVSKCAQIAQEEGASSVTIGHAVMVCYDQTFDLNEIKEKITVVKAFNRQGQWREYDAKNDSIWTYTKYKVETLHEATNPTADLTRSWSLPAEVGSIRSDEIVLIQTGGAVTINGIEVGHFPVGASLTSKAELV